MLSVNKFFEEVSYKEIVASLVAVMAKNFDDFAVDQTRFKGTISWLEKELETGASPSVTALMDSIDQQIGSTILFSYFLGLKANWDHFIDPIGRTFLDVDSETYLRENMAKQLPEYQNAQHIQEQFYTVLSPVQRDRYEDITAYITHLETVGPKLAHYFGYILGNNLLSRIVPSYHPDSSLTFRYQVMLKSYLGKQQLFF